jgi:hypothetical protein
MALVFTAIRFAAHGADRRWLRQLNCSLSKRPVTVGHSILGNDNYRRNSWVGMLTEPSAMTASTRTAEMSPLKTITTYRQVQIMVVLRVPTFRRNILASSSGWLNVVQVGDGMNGRRQCFDYVRGFQDLCSVWCSRRQERSVVRTLAISHGLRPACLSF